MIFKSFQFILIQVLENLPAAVLKGLAWAEATAIARQVRCPPSVQLCPAAEWRPLPYAGDGSSAVVNLLLSKRGQFCQ